MLTHTHARTCTHIRTHTHVHTVTLRSRCFRVFSAAASRRGWITGVPMRRNVTSHPSVATVASSVDSRSASPSACHVKVRASRCVMMCHGGLVNVYKFNWPGQCSYWILRHVKNACSLCLSSLLRNTSRGNYLCHMLLWSWAVCLTKGLNALCVYYMCEWLCQRCMLCYITSYTVIWSLITCPVQIGIWASWFTGPGHSHPPHHNPPHLYTHVSLHDSGMNIAI